MAKFSQALISFVEPNFSDNKNLQIRKKIIKKERKKIRKKERKKEREKERKRDRKEGRYQLFTKGNTSWLLKPLIKRIIVIWFPKKCQRHAH